MEPMEHSMSHLLYNQVDQIADVKTYKINNVETKYYKVRWKCTWEPETVLERFCGGIIKEYKKSTDIDLHPFPDNMTITNKEPINLKIQKRSIDEIKNENDNTTFINIKEKADNPIIFDDNNTSINITDKFNNPTISDDNNTARNITDKFNNPTISDDNSTARNITDKNPTIFDSTTPGDLSKEIQVQNIQYDNINKSINVVLNIKPDPETDSFPDINILDNPANRNQCDLISSHSTRVADNLNLNGDSFVGDVEMSQTVSSIDNNEVNMIYNVEAPTLKRPTMSDLASSSSFGASNINYNDQCKFNKDVEVVVDATHEEHLQNKIAKTSRQLHSWQAHWMAGGIEKGFKCKVCSYFTLRGSNFRRHIRKHLGDKPFECHLCSYCAGQKHQLTQHLANHHTGEKTLKCFQCSYSTSHAGNLKTHVDTQHSINQTI